MARPRESRYRHLAERLRRPLEAVFVLAGVFLLAEAIWVDRGAQAVIYAVALLVGSLVSAILPDRDRPLHPPSESTLQWAKRRRRERS
jgi:hypothetical protein